MTPDDDLPDDDLVVSVRAAIPVDDLDRAISFYERTLGFVGRVLSRDLHMAWMEHGSHGFLLFATSGDQPPTRANTVLTIAVTDIAAMVARLHAVGVEFEGSADDPINDLDGSRSAWFRDSEGNFIEVSQRPGAASPHS